MVRFGEHRVQIMPTNGRLSYTHARVEVHERMDGTIAAYYQGQCLSTKPAPAEAPVLRVRNTKRVMPDRDERGNIEALTQAKKRLQPKALWRPAQDHPWRRPFRVYVDRG